MPKKAKELSAIEIKGLTKQGLHAVGGVAGLALNVAPSGARSWIFRCVVGLNRREMGLGGYPDVSLSQARNKARELRDKVNDGIDPIEERRTAKKQLRESQSKKLTFDDAAKQFLATKKSEFKNKKHAGQWESTLKTYASPVIGNEYVSDIDINHIIRILEPIWFTKTETAKRLRGRIEKVLSWATVTKYRSGDNPARWMGHLDAVLPMPTKITKVKHHKAMPWQSIGSFISDLKKRDGISAKALQFLILTAGRSGEIRGANWDEIDFDSKMWIIPAERMKMDREHRVPLSKEALKLLESLNKDPENNLLFPSNSGRILSDMTLSAVLKRMKIDATVHGFRSCFRDWCAEYTNHPTAVAEMALAHTIGNKVEAAYRRGDLLAKRKNLMQDWAKFCNTAKMKGDVISIREAKS